MPGVLVMSAGEESRSSRCAGIDNFSERGTVQETGNPFTRECQLEIVPTGLREFRHRTSRQLLAAVAQAPLSAYSELQPVRELTSLFRTGFFI
jgi:hypothetical protein